jgi:hypothetical protein
LQPKRRSSGSQNTIKPVLHCNIIWPQTIAQTRQLFDAQTALQALAGLGKLQAIKGSPCRHKPEMLSCAAVFVKDNATYNATF